MSDAPEVSVVVAVYLSEATLDGFLDALARQTFRDFETILVDSGPTEACERIVARREEPLVHVRSAGRLFPQAARNTGVERSSGRLLVFTDPDVYAAPDWLERLVAAHRETGNVVVGALACHGSKWLDRGVHLCKFSKWLPGGERRPVDMSPTANMLLPLDLFEETGRFHGDMLMGDATLSRDLLEAGRTLLFEPGAVVDHHHLETVRSFVRERWLRGIRYGRLRGGWMRRRKPLLFSLLLGSLFPLRIASNAAHCARHAARAGELRTFLSTLPVVVLGFSASILGEAKGYAEALLGASRGSDSS
ncbi:MAG TPA: glycosyltransferase [Thermoanaerobaculia bacterium]|nr:glycosyltransferase [Thermoanaerobaculia bacterium]